MKRPFKLKPYISEVIWGGTRLLEDYNMTTEKKNAAEAWVLSCHEAGQSIALTEEYGEIPLGELLEKEPSLFGSCISGCERFPILVKFIDARDNLSVQVHPTDEYCALTGKGESKTECWYILDCDDDACLILGFRENITQDEMKSAIESGTLTDYIAKVPVKKGDFFFIESGTLHAICKGILLAEVQQSSNTTYRVFDYNRKGFDGKPRELHVKDAVAVTKCEKYDMDRFFISAGESGEAKRLLTDNDFFKVWEVNSSSGCCESADDSSFVSVLVLEGEGSLSCGGNEMSLIKGDSVFIPAGAGSFEIKGNVKFLETRV